jgi:two-component system, OmpR family, alkaline phosphatase synthesis response regulator PhoP
MIRVLIVEDDPMIAEGLRDDLELEGYRVDVVADGAAAEKAAMAARHDLIVLDIMLPQKSGYDVCRAVRTAGIKTPIVILTARGQEEDRVRGLELGADDYVVKPFSPRELMARVKAVLRRSESSDDPRDDIWQDGDLRIDFGKFEATRCGETLALTATEFKLLKALYQDRGRVVAMEQLLRRVWGRDVFLTDRVVYTHVNNLRAKIESDPACPTLIVGVRGIGYRFAG